MADKEKTTKEEKPAPPETVSLKEVADKAGIDPRQCRSILRGLDIRGDDQKRSRWTFEPKDAAGVVAKIKAKIAERAAAKEAKDSESADEETADS